MKAPIVNEQDEIIGYKERDELTHQDIRRVAHIWIFNDKKEILIAKRQSTKKVSPNKWGPSAAGTLEEGDTYESNAYKELEEEIGLQNVTLIPLKKIFYENSNGRRFCYMFTASVNMEEKDFVLQKDEVAEVKWISLDALLDWYKKLPSDFIPSTSITINLIKDYLYATQS